MLSLGQVTPIVSETDNIKRFKPWWEYIADYTSHFLLWLGLIAWTNVLSDNASGVRCVQHKNSSTFSSIQARYCSQKCSLELYDGVMVHYPYTIFLQWIIFLFNQIFWLKLPFVCSKLEAVHKITQDMIQRSVNSTHKEDDEKTVNKESVRLGYLLQDFSTCNISEVYYVKSLFSATASVAFTVFILKAFPMFPRLLRERNVKCGVSESFGDQKQTNCPVLLCNLGSGRFVYGLIVANLFVLGVFFGMSLLSFYMMRSKSKHINRKFASQVKRQQGWKDICFAFCLMNIDFNKNDNLLREFKRCIKSSGVVDEGCNFNDETPFNI